MATLADGVELFTFRIGYRCTRPSEGGGGEGVQVGIVWGDGEGEGRKGDGENDTYFPLTFCSGGERERKER